MDCNANSSWSDCSSNLSSSNSFYNSDEECDWMSCASHDYICSKCSKPEAILESYNSAKHRASERIKLVEYRIMELSNMSDDQLRRESNHAGTLSRSEIETSLLLTFIKRNKPLKSYRLANKIYNIYTSNLK